MFLLLGIPEASAAAVRRGERERQAIDIGEGSTICTSIGESNSVRARDKVVRVLLLGGVLDSMSGVELMERLLKSVDDGKSESAFVLKDENRTSGGVGGPPSFAFCRDSSRNWTSASILDRTSVSKTL